MRTGVIERGQRHDDTAQELHEEFSGELGLQLKHLGVKTTVSIPMTLNIEIQGALLVRAFSLGLANELEQVAGGPLKTLICQDNVIKGNSISTGL